HFAYVIISLAMLGYGASGTLVSLLGPRARFSQFFPAACLGFALTDTGGFLLAQQVAFNPLELLWDSRQWLRLAAVYLLLFFPFLFAATAVCLALSRFDHRLSRIYAVDLVGAALGALGVIGLLRVFHPLPALGLIAALGCLAAALTWRGIVRPVLALTLAAGLIAFLGAGSVEIRLSPYKPLSQALAVAGAKVLKERSGPLGLLTVVANDRVPFRYAPGLSLNSIAPLPPQLAVFTDGNSMSAITRFRGDFSPLRFLDQMPTALPYHLLTRPEVAVLGAGGGLDVLQALVLGAEHVDAVELDPNRVALIREDFARFAGHLYEHPKVGVHLTEARGFIQASPKRYDLIQVGLLDAFATAASGLHALNETYLYTVEGLAVFLHHLKPRGLLAISRWTRLPPREEIKLFATAVATLKRLGISDPGKHLVWVRSWNTIVLLVKATPFTPVQIRAVHRFCQERGFDPAYYPGMPPQEANRFHRLPQPYYHRAALALLRDPVRFYRDYKFDIHPATDDRPYFFHTFKWSSLPELWHLRHQGGIALLDSAYLLLAGSLLLLIPTSALLIIAPLLAPMARAARPAPRQLGYFLAVGIGFMFLEIALIQKFILYLAHPLYAVAVVLTGILFWAGFGSASLARLQRRFPALSPSWPVVAITVFTAVDLALLPWLTRTTGHLSDGYRILLPQLLLAPLAWCMGLPLPLGLRRLTDEAGSVAAGRFRIAWAWAVNGCASVTAAVLASLLAIHLGLTMVIGLGLGAYVLAALLLRRKAQRNCKA
ncbi:MAG TPA: SAM-dependent methyltransferase, partial [Methylothermaceae bacterium]|nr:SAM-dependent methyltransferase [Methylothermaceae bacterium]